MKIKIPKEEYNALKLVFILVIGVIIVAFLLVIYFSTKPPVEEIHTVTPVVEQTPTINNSSEAQGESVDSFFDPFGLGLIPTLILGFIGWKIIKLIFD